MASIVDGVSISSTTKRLGEDEGTRWYEKPDLEEPYRITWGMSRDSD